MALKAGGTRYSGVLNDCSKTCFSFKNNAQHLDFVTVRETDFFFSLLKHLIYLISTYITLAFGNNLSVTVRTNLPPVAASVISGAAVRLWRTCLILKFLRVIQLLLSDGSEQRWTAWSSVPNGFLMYLAFSIDDNYLQLKL